MRREEIIGVAFAAALVAHVALLLTVAGREFAVSPEVAAHALGESSEVKDSPVQPMRTVLGVAAREPMPPRPLVPALPVGSLRSSPDIGEGWPDAVKKLAASMFPTEPALTSAAGGQDRIGAAVSASAVRLDITPVRRELPGVFRPRPSLAKAAESVRAEPEQPDAPPGPPRAPAPGFAPPAGAGILPYPEMQLFRPTR